MDRVVRSTIEPSRLAASAWSTDAWTSTASFACLAERVNRFPSAVTTTGSAIAGAILRSSATRAWSAVMPPTSTPPTVTPLAISSFWLWS